MPYVTCDEAWCDDGAASCWTDHWVPPVPAVLHPVRRYAMDDLAAGWALSPVPQYRHDCDNCQFLGRMAHLGLHRQDGREWRELHHLDLYVCVPGVDSGDDPSFIARHGSDGWAYTSSPAWVVERMLKRRPDLESTLGPCLIEAHRRWMLPLALRD